MEKGQWIYWRWKLDGKTFSKSKIQDIVNTSNGPLLELGDDLWTNYPTRVLVKEIDIVDFITASMSSLIVTSTA